MRDIGSYVTKICITAFMLLMPTESDAIAQDSVTINVGNNHLLQLPLDNRQGVSNPILYCEFKNNITQRCKEISRTDSLSVMDWFMIGRVNQAMSEQGAQGKAINSTNKRLNELKSSIDTLAEEIRALNESAVATMGTALVEQFRSLPLAMIDDPTVRQELRKMIAEEIRAAYPVPEE